MLIQPLTLLRKQRTPPTQLKNSAITSETPASKTTQRGSGLSVPAELTPSLTHHQHLSMICLKVSFTSYENSPSTAEGFDGYTSENWWKLRGSANQPEPSSPPMEWGKHPFPQEPVLASPSGLAAPPCRPRHPHGLSPPSSTREPICAGPTP